MYVDDIERRTKQKIRKALYMIMHTTSHFKSNFYQPNFYVGRTLYAAFNNILVCNYLNLQIKQKIYIFNSARFLVIHLRKWNSYYLESSHIIIVTCRKWKPQNSVSRDFEDREKVISRNSWCHTLISKLTQNTCKVSSRTSPPHSALSLCKTASDIQLEKIFS